MFSLASTQVPQRPSNSAVPMGDLESGFDSVSSRSDCTSLGAEAGRRSVSLRGFKEFYDKSLAERKVDGVRNWTQLTGMGKAMGYYGLESVISASAALGTILKSASGQFFYPPSQWIFIFTFIIDGINIRFFAHRERSAVEGFAQTARAKAANAEDLGLESQEISSRKLSGVVGNSLIEMSVFRKYFANAATLGSVLAFTSALLALIVQYQGETLVPLHEGSSSLAIADHCVTLLSVVLSIPFYGQVVKDVFNRISPSLDMGIRCKTFWGEDNPEDITEDCIFRAMRSCLPLYQRTKELTLRFLSLSVLVVSMLLLSVWEILQLTSLKYSIDESDAPARDAAEWLNIPMLTAFSIGTSLYLLNFIIKGVVDYNRFLKRQNAAKELKNLDVESDKFDQYMEDSLRVDSSLLLWGIVDWLKNSGVSEDSKIVKFLEDSGVTRDTLKLISDSGKTSQDYENAAYLLALQFGLLDLI